MENKLNNLKDKMNKTVLRDVYFSDELEQKVIGSIMNSKFHKDLSSVRHRFTPLLSLTVTAIFFLGISYFLGTELHLFKGDQGSSASVPNEKIIETKPNLTDSSKDNPNGEWETPDKNNPSTCPFKLTLNEEKAYESFQRDLDLTHIEGLGPISIAKLYVKAGFDKKYNIQYALYTDRPEYIIWSKEEDEKIPESDRGTNEQNHKLFKNIDKGRFVQTSDYDGYIEYYPNDNSKVKSGFNMIKNENGVWQVAFMPIQ